MVIIWFFIEVIRILLKVKFLKYYLVWKVYELNYICKLCKVICRFLCRRYVFVREINIIGWKIIKNLYF